MLFIFNLFSRLTCDSICKWYFEYVDKIKSVFVYKDVCTDDCLFIEPAQCGFLCFCGKE